MDLGIVMRREVLEDKLEEGRVWRRAVATWNTRRLPTRLTPGWTNRLVVACQGAWRGAFTLSGDVFWNPRDAAAPYALIFDPRTWTPITPAIPCAGFRGWRYVESPLGAESPPSSTARLSPPAGLGEVLSQEFLEERAIKRWCYFPHRLLRYLPHRP